MYLAISFFLLIVVTLLYYTRIREQFCPCGVDLTKKINNYDNSNI